MMKTLLLNMPPLSHVGLIQKKATLQLIGSTNIVKIKTHMNWILNLLPTLNIQGERGLPGHLGMPGQPGRSISGPKVNK